MKSFSQKRKRVRPLLGTYVSIELSGPVAVRQLDAWINRGFEAIAQVDRLMSRFRPDSDISRLNTARPGEWIKIHPWTRDVLRAANQLYKSSKGMFDIRCLAPTLPLSANQGSLPPVEIRGNQARRFGTWKLDLGGMAKGYAVDQVCDQIQKLSRGRGINGCVNAGGDLRIWGRKKRVIAIDSGNGFRSVQVAQMAMATSSIRTADGRRYSPAVHFQMPSRNPMRQSKTTTVFADRCLWADALTKVVLTAPPSAWQCISSYNARAVIYPTSTSPGQSIR
jgi:thiamine biosynthesis lipoprotein